MRGLASASLLAIAARSERLLAASIVAARSKFPISPAASMTRPACSRRRRSSGSRRSCASSRRTPARRSAILTIPTLDGESLEEYSLRVAETWKLGRGKFDDGALVLIARDDRQMRIEVGYGLEPALTDAKSRRILDDLMRPRFREGDFDGGVEKAVKAIDGLVRGDENALPAPEPKSGVEGVAPRAIMFLVFAVVIGIFSLVALATEGAGAWFFYLFLTPFWLAFPIAIFGSRFGAFVRPGLVARLSDPPPHPAQEAQVRQAVQEHQVVDRWSARRRLGVVVAGWRVRWQPRRVGRWRRRILGRRRELRRRRRVGEVVMRLALMTWPEVEGYLATSKGILIPIGSTEQHGPNGLLGTDHICPETVAVLVGEAVGAAVAPALAIGMSQHHMRFPGSMTLKPSTLLQVVRDVVESLASHGFDHIYFLNGHGGNIATLQAAFSEIWAAGSSRAAAARCTCGCATGGAAGG